MSDITRRLSRSAVLLLVISVFAAGIAARLEGASYLPLRDADLVRRAPMVVRATVVSQETRREPFGGDPAAVFTLTTLRTVEVIRSGGERLSPGDPFRLELPGGRDGDAATWMPGTPVFTDGSEVLLFLSPQPWRSGDYALTELGLSKFDLVADTGGRRFAVRPAFSDDEDDAASARRRGKTPTSAAGGSRSLRDAEAFLAFVRDTAAGRQAEPVLYAAPEGDLTVAAGGSAPGKHPLWVNIGGVEGTGSLFRWYWDTGLSPAAIVSATGTQSGLTDGSSGLASVQNGAAQWSAVPEADVRYSTTSGSASVLVRLDVVSEPPAWSEPLSCGTGGVIGYGGPGTSTSAPPFKGSSGYFAPAGGNVWMRKVTGGCYSAATFRAAVLHELGHTLGLGHSDQGASIHSTTTEVEWNAAVMHSVIPASNPSTPQSDDIQAIQYYYGSLGVGATPPTAAFSYSPAAPVAGDAISFGDASDGSPTAWLWAFGDGTSSTARNPIKTYTGAGTFTVTLIASNGGGSSSASRVLRVAAAGPPAVTAPSAAFGFTPADPVPGVAVQFADASTGATASWAWTFGDPSSGAANASTLTNPSHTFAAAGSYTVSLTVANAGGTSVMSRTVAVGSCSSSGTALCLNGGRFRAEAIWSVPSQRTSGTGTAVPLTSDTGYFWFFTSNNVELVVKVLDGRAVNGRFWVFSGALSDVEYTLRITDTATGAVQTYFNPQGTLSSFSDADAFAADRVLPDRLARPSGDPAPGGVDAKSVSTSGEDAGAPCRTNPTTLCLNQGRFRVRIGWEVPAQGFSGDGTAVSLTADTGYFWFFSPNNAEVLLKVVDGRAFNGHFWVFSGALSNVQYTITVTDTTTGITNSYANPSGSLRSFSDVAAF